MEEFVKTRNCINSAVNFKSVSMVEAVVADIVQIKIPCGLSLPQTVNSNLQFKFQIPHNAGLYLDPMQTRLALDFHVSQQGGAKLPLGTLMAPICGVAQTFWDKLKIYGNGQLIKSYYNMAYQNHVLITMNYTKSYTDRFLKDTCFWALDSEPATPPSTLVFNSNKGLEWRSEKASESATVDLYFLPFIPLWNTDKLIPTSPNWVLEFTCNPCDFCLFSMDQKIKKFEISITRAELFVTQVALKSQLSNELRSFKNLNFEFLDYQLDSYSISKGQREALTPITNIVQTPRRFYCFLLTESASLGNIAECRFHYQNFGLEQLKLYINGRTFSIESNFTKGQVVEAFSNSICKGLSKYDCDIPISLQSFLMVNSILIFDVSPSTVGGSCAQLPYPLKTPGNYSLSVRFATPLKQVVNLYCLAEYDNLMTIVTDHNGNTLNIHLQT
jgi:hypothetical protein